MATVSTAAGLQGWGCRGKSQFTPTVRTSFSGRGVSVTRSSAPVRGLWWETRARPWVTRTGSARGEARHPMTPDTDERDEAGPSRHYSLMAGRSDRETFQRAICSDGVCERNMFENHHIHKFICSNRSLGFKTCMENILIKHTIGKLAHNQIKEFTKLLHHV